MTAAAPVPGLLQMLPTSVLCGAAVGAVVLLLAAGPPRLGTAAGGAEQSGAPRADQGRGGRRGWSAGLAGLGAALFVGGPLAPLVGVVAAAAAWWWLGRVEPAAVRRERAAVRRDLPHLVHLLGASLRSGAAPAHALRLVCAALPGPAATRLRPLAEQLALGADPALVWGSLARDEVLGPLGRTLARSHQTGASVVAAVDRLGEDLAASARAEVEHRARAVGVRAALPLGLCLLPSFLLLGIVPLVAGLVSGLAE